MSDSERAVGALGRAVGLEKAARARSGWYARYLWIFAAGQLVLVPVSLLWHGPASAVFFALANTLLVTGLSVYAARQRVVRRGFGLKHGLLIGSWATVFGLAVVLGTTVFTDDVAFAAAAALGCALPPALGAWSESRGTA
ncbi:MULTISPECIES: hypothetical protein [Streptomyces]|uniref:hypothetical protein n=1 Tax=Streptomyces TaxID=1883 RepID=UPI00226E3F07|nr:MULTISPECIES: hypothetical protein [unclassified Streptomyces]MCY0942858.1 hypothetical protein [Streptomyces sp. H34-AA3]MCY0951125.1 hypothetical protein [Streptomyces sp. H27-S2]MCZ4085907.1 hypothetical protein [Streptomyces sp. H34-S5]